MSDEERRLAFDLQENQRDEFVSPSIQGYNSWPFYSRTMSLDSSAVLDTGANSTYVNYRRLLVNQSSPLSTSVMVADGTTHTRRVVSLDFFLSRGLLNLPKILLVCH